MPKPYSNTLNLTDLLLRWKNELKNSSNKSSLLPLIHSNISSFEELCSTHNNINHISALVGTDGSLPREMSLSGLISELEKGNKSVSAFFTIFEKYYFYLLYKSQFKYNWSLLYEQQATIKKTSKLSLLLNSLCRKTIEKKQYQSYYYSGISILVPSNKKINNLKYWLEHYFEMSLHLQYSAPKCQYLKNENMTKLNQNNNKLGINTILGNQCSLYGDRIDIFIEVNSITEYHNWREDKERIRLIYDACYFYYKMEAKFNLKIRVPSYLIQENNSINKSYRNNQLGINTFLGEANNTMVEILL